MMIVRPDLKYLFQHSLVSTASGEGFTALLAINNVKSARRCQHS